MKICLMLFLAFSFIAFAGERYGVYDSKGSRIVAFEAEQYELLDKAQQIKAAHPNKNLFISSMQKGKGSKPLSHYRYKAETGAYIEAMRKETFTVCPDKEIQGTWISEHSVHLNAQNCVSVQAPNLAGTFRVLFLENSGRTDTIQVLVEQSYIQMGDYSHRIWVVDFECKRMVIRSNNEFHLLCPEDYDKIGHYENRSYSQPLIADKTKFTMSDAQYYSKLGDMGITHFVLEKYKNENLEESKLPLVETENRAWKFANERSKREGLDTAYIELHSSSKEAGKLILLGDPSFGNCELCTKFAVDTTASGYRLPFEEEWFFLMRAGASAKYYWGNEENPKTVSLYEWVRPTELKPVAKLRPNGFRLYDMVGLADEYVFYYKKDKYWDSGKPCNGSGDLRPECALVEEIGMQRQYTRSANKCELEVGATEWKCETKQEIMTERVMHNIGFRFVRKTPKLHKLEKF